MQHIALTHKALLRRAYHSAASRGVRLVGAVGTIAVIIVPSLQRQVERSATADGYAVYWMTRPRSRRVTVAAATAALASAAAAA